jgi:catechol 2,3-dioxygenase-like lactoylglutathione lyase family enzyme
VVQELQLRPGLSLRHHVPNGSPANDRLGLTLPSVVDRSFFIDHLTLRVRDLERSRTCYEKALEPFGIRVVESFQGQIGLGPEGREDFWIREGEPTAPVHLAFAAANRETVEAFHRAALGAGGLDNGAPCLRPHYHSRYYAAYVIDPDGSLRTLI